jgi:excisionase family DNA binding protein
MRHSTRVPGEEKRPDLGHEDHEGNIDRAGGERLLRVKEAADTLAISVRALYRLVANGQLPAPLKIGKSTRFPVSDIEHYIDALKSGRKGGAE